MNINTVLEMSHMDVGMCVFFLIILPGKHTVSQFAVQIDFPSLETAALLSGLSVVRVANPCCVISFVSQVKISKQTALY